MFSYVLQKKRRNFCGYGYFDLFISNKPLAFIPWAYYSLIRRIDVWSGILVLALDNPYWVHDICLFLKYINNVQSFFFSFFRCFTDMINETLQVFPQIEIKKFPLLLIRTFYPWIILVDHLEILDANPWHP